VLDDTSAYTETSGSAGLAAGLVKFNEAIGSPLYNKQIQRAIAGVLGRVSANGTVTGVSAGTAVMNDAAGYKGVANKRVKAGAKDLLLYSCRHC